MASVSENRMINNLASCEHLRATCRRDMNPCEYRFEAWVIGTWSSKEREQSKLPRQESSIVP